MMFEGVNGRREAPHAIPENPSHRARSFTGMLLAGRLTATCHWQRCLCQHLPRSEREGCDAVRGAPLSAVREVCSAEGDDRRPSGFRVRKRIMPRATQQNIALGVNMQTE